MFETIRRFIKGLLMGGLFGLFLLGIFIELLIALPIIWVLDRIFGSNHSRMQWAVRMLVSLWLFMLKGCGLLTDRAAKGKPFDGPCVIVSNHPGLFDVLFLIRYVPHMSVMVKQSLAKKLPLGPVFRSAGYVLSPDFDQRGPFQSLDEAIEKIHMGYKFMIFPEATRSPKGDLGKFNAGPFMLARLSNVPVQPLFVRNDPPFLPKEDRWYFPPSRVSTLEIEFWETMAPPRVGQEREFASNLETRYRKALGLTIEKNSVLSAGKAESHGQSPWQLTNARTGRHLPTEVGTHSALAEDHGFLQPGEMEQNGFFPAEPLIPQRRRMKLIDWVKRPAQNSLQAEATVTEAWPLNNDGKVDSIICVELVAQTVSALSTWRRGEGAKPRVGLLVGIKEVEFSDSSIPVKTRLLIQVEEVYHVGDYAVFQGIVSSELSFYCKINIQVIEPEGEVLPNLKTGQRIQSEEKERKN
jgi:1-acyl-sn-glycerol-3-phosphate acyltransferase